MPRTVPAMDPGDVPGDRARYTQPNAPYDVSLCCLAAEISPKASWGTT